MTDLDALLARAEPALNGFTADTRIVRDLVDAVRDLRERHTTALAETDRLRDLSVFLSRSYLSDLTDTTCEHGRPDHQVLIRQLAEALGLDLPALPDTPASVWHRLLGDVRDLRERHTTALAVLKSLATTCRECRDELPFSFEGRGVPRADFIIWGKLSPPEALGPKCYDHAVKHLGRDLPYRSDQYAVVDLRDVWAVLDEATRETT